MMPDMSTSTSSSSALPPRASISTLPLELKQYIAQLCADDDDDSHKRREALRMQLHNCDDHEHEYNSDDEPTDDIHKMDDAVETFVSYASCRRIVPRLFQVSREWADIMAPHRFKTVRYSNFVSRSLSSYTAPANLKSASFLQVAHFRDHDVRRVDPHLVDSAISMIGPSARRLVLDAATAERLVQDVDEAAIRNKLAVIEEVEVEHSPASALALLDTMPRVQSVVLSVHRPELTDLLLRDLFKAAPSMRELSIRQPEIWSSGAYPARPSLRWEGLPALRSIKFEGQDLSPVVLDLVLSSAPTLRSLDLRLDSFNAQPALDTNIIFPRLVRLTLVGRCTSLAPVLESLSETAMPNLVELALGNRDELFEDPNADKEFGEPHDDTISSPLPLLDNLLLPSGRPHRTLATVFIFDPVRLFRADELDYLERTIAEHYSTYEWDFAPVRRWPSRAVFPDAVEHARTSAASAERVRRGLRRTLDHVNALYERASASTGTGEGMSSDDERRIARLAEALSEFEFDRVERGL
ncbi:hypothetical protein JCM9279_002406 [Rhodotorula babjevae]